MSVAATSAGSVGHVRRLRLPARERRVPGDGRDRAAVAAERIRREFVGEEQPRRYAPESTPCSSATAWANRRAQRYGSPRRYETFSVQVQARPAFACLVLDRGEESRLAHAGLADHDDDPATAGPAAAVDRGLERRELAQRGRRTARARRRRYGIQAPMPGLAAERVQLDGRRLAAQDDRAAVVGREAAAGGRDRRAVEQDLAGSGQRLDPGRRRDRLAGQPQVAVQRGPPGRATTSPVAIPIRTSIGSAPSPIIRRPARMAMAASAARTASSSWATRPAEDREHGIADEFLARAVEPLDGLGHGREGRRDPGPDHLGVVLGEHADVVDQVGEQGGDDAPVTERRPGRPARRGAPASRSVAAESGAGKRRPAAIAEARVGRAPASRRPDSAPARCPALRRS